MMPPLWSVIAPAMRPELTCANAGAPKNATAATTAKEAMTFRIQPHVGPMIPDLVNLIAIPPQQSTSVGSANKTLIVSQAWSQRESGLAQARWPSHVCLFVW
jgi:hypothetical protein